MRAIVRLAAAAAFLALVSPLAAQGKDPESCRTNPDGDAAIEACNRVINSGRYSRSDVARAYLDRGQRYYTKNEIDRAIADASTAISTGALNAESLAIAYSNRGNGWFVKDDIDRAIADYTTAIRTNSRFAAPLTARGLLKEKSGDIEGALRDFRAALRIENRNRFDDDRWARETAERKLRELDRR